jgi:uncharacterized membrane protein YkvI
VPVARGAARWVGLAATYVGMVVGAGFAGGRELEHFFARHGAWGLAGIGMATALFSALGAAILARCADQRHRHYGELLLDVCGPLLGRALDALLWAGLVVSLAAVLAAAGALASAALHWPRSSGSLLFAGLVAGGALTGVPGWIALNVLAVPLIAGSLLLAGAQALARGVAAWPAGTGGPGWAVSAVLYVAYNVFLGAAGLASACRAQDTRADALAGGAVGGLVLGLVGAAGLLALFGQTGVQRMAELPLAYALPAGWWRHGLYPATLLLALWTTGAAAAIALGRRLHPPRPGPAAALAVLGATPLALGGLHWIVGVLYPAVGLAGFPLLFCVGRAALRPPPAASTAWHRPGRRVG